MENKKQEPPEIFSTQINLPLSFRQAFTPATMAIPNDHLSEDGRETEPHVTVKYGLHEEDPKTTAEALKGGAPIDAPLGKVSIFSNDKFDVVKIGVTSHDLHRLNKKISKLPHTDSHPDYNPHLTLAYVKPGLGDKYKGRSIKGLTGKDVSFGHVIFSSKNRVKTK